MKLLSVLVLVCMLSCEVYSQGVDNMPAVHEYPYYKMTGDNRGVTTSSPSSDILPLLIAAWALSKVYIDYKKQKNVT
jgi:hypothetical protein